jgi:hypothetical protein
VIKEYLPAFGSVGVLLYGLLRIAYVFFYLRLRTTPEDVGYGYARILAESVAGAVELSLLCAAVIAALAIAYYAGRGLLALLRRRRRAAGSRRSSVRQVPRVPLRRVVVWSLAIGTAVVLASLPVLAWWQGGLARGGQTVRNVYFVGIPYLPVLAVQAVPADVTWVDGDAGKPFPLTNRECLMYLGAANGTSVFYDVRTAESVRLPSGSITVTLRFTFFAPDRCRQ